MVDNSGKILSKVKPWRIVFPIAIGIGISLFFLRDFDYKSLSLLEISFTSLFFLVVAFFFMLIRDAGYVWRLKMLAGGKLSWRQCIQIIMLWEFTSAVTPSAVGGTSVAIFFINKEGVSLGLSSAMVLMTSFLDELYFIVVFPLVLFFLWQMETFGTGDGAGGSSTLLENQYFVVAMIGYLLKFVYAAVVFYGLFVNPRGLKWLLLMIFRLPIIRKWRPKANVSADDLIVASSEFKHWPKRKWFKTLLATALSWTSRYWVVNALVLSLFGASVLGFQDHIIIFGKQLVMWVVMLITPTPGGSGFAEYVFKEFMSAELPVDKFLGMENFVAFLWRLVSYYPYLIIGATFVPHWIRKHFVRLD